MNQSLLDTVPRAQLKLHTPPDSASLAAYRRRLRMEWAAYQTEESKATLASAARGAYRQYLEAVASETAEYRRFAE